MPIYGRTGDSKNRMVAFQVSTERVEFGALEGDAGNYKLFLENLSKPPPLWFSQPELGMIDSFGEPFSTLLVQCTHRLRGVTRRGICETRHANHESYHGGANQSTRRGSQRSQVLLKPIITYVEKWGMAQIWIWQGTHRR